MRGRPWCWILRDPRALPAPIPCKGKLGLWTVEADVVTAGGAVE
jgi:hypothetical protein